MSLAPRLLFHWNPIDFRMVAVFLCVEFMAIFVGFPQQVCLDYLKDRVYVHDHEVHVLTHQPNENEQYLKSEESYLKR